MSFLRRPELWILAVIAAVAAYFALRTPAPEDSFSPVEGGAPAGKLTVTDLTITRDFGNARLDLSFTYDNRGGTEVTLAPPEVSLLAGGESVPPFFLVGDFPDPLPANRRTTGTTKYWLEPQHFSQAISFEVKGESVPIKTSAPFDIDSLENAKPTSLKPGSW